MKPQSVMIHMKATEQYFIPLVSFVICYTLVPTLNLDGTVTTWQESYTGKTGTSFMSKVKLLDGKEYQLCYAKKYLHFLRFQNLLVVSSKLVKLQNLAV